jgi:hypothetical protein
MSGRPFRRPQFRLAVLSAVVCVAVGSACGQSFGNSQSAVLACSNVRDSQSYGSSNALNRIYSSYSAASQAAEAAQGSRKYESLDRSGQRLAQVARNYSAGGRWDLEMFTAELNMLSICEELGETQ